MISFESKIRWGVNAVNAIILRFLFSGWHIDRPNERENVHNNFIPFQGLNQGRPLWVGFLALMMQTVN